MALKNICLMAYVYTTYNKRKEMLQDYNIPLGKEFDDIFTHTTIY